MIDFERKYIFLHFPKTGGSSIEVMLSGFEELGMHDVADYVILQKVEIKKYFPFGRHAKLYQYEKLLKTRGQTLDDFKVFTLIRHPRDLLSSLYRFRIKNYENVKGNMSWIRRMLYRVYSSNYSLFLIFVLVVFSICMLIPDRRVLKRFEFLGLYRDFFRNDSNKIVKIFRLEDVSLNPSTMFKFLGMSENDFGMPEHNKTYQKTARSKSPWLSKWVSFCIYKNRIAMYYSSEY